ncbi:MAG: MBL fold metallo-hydrolase [Granulosicoccus sp.]
MDTTFTFTLLGTGSSGGVPRVGNQWGNCDPDNPLNRRRRCALLIEREDSQQHKTTVLVDTGADLREQLLAANVKHLDGVLITHSHADHVFGMDDLRQLAISMKSPIPVYMDEATESIVLRSFNYVFHQAENSSYPAFCSKHSIEHHQTIKIPGAGGEVKAVPLLVEHGDIHALGFRFGSLAYLPDIKRMSDERSLAALTGVSTLIIDALRHSAHPSHMNLEESLRFIDQIKPERAVLTNMHTDLDYQTLKVALPAGIVPGYDGMVLTAQAELLPGK